MNPLSVKWHVLGLQGTKEKEGKIGLNIYKVIFFGQRRRAKKAD